MTQLLISVRNATEAATVAGHSVAILDVKEPNRGALGAPEPSTLRQVSQTCSKNQTMSFAAGELREWLGPIRNHNGCLLASRYGELLKRFRYVKVGLHQMRYQQNWQLDWHTLFQCLPEGTSPVMVAYFDYKSCQSPLPQDLIDFAANEENCSTVLFDTYNKTKNLFAHVDPRQLEDLVGQTRSAGLHSVVAGSVDETCLADVLATAPDFVGVRGAVCRGDREGQIEDQLVSELVATMQARIQK